MSRQRNIFSNIALAAVGASIIYVFIRNRKRILCRLKRTLDFKNALRHQKVEVVTTISGCQELAKQLKRDCETFKVVGFDCEWVTVGGSRRPVSLLQLASQSGLCGLFRLNMLQAIPLELRELLQDEDILKVGIVPQDDARALAKEYGVIVASTLDLRHLAFKAGRKPLGLSKMASDLLKIELDKDWRISCSDWEASELSDRQMRYAASDAHAAVEMFKVLMNEISPSGFWQSKQSRWDEIRNICDPFLDWKFSGKSGQSSSNTSITSTKTKNATKTQFDRKTTSRAMSTRSKALYDNCFLQAPDGELLCTCDRSKSDWYVSQNLGILICEEPYTVRLNFEPSGRAVGDVGKYYQLAKENRCVVCGRTDGFIRKNVVPREYRKHFPGVMKSHTSHDVLLLCTNCHQRSNISDLAVRHKLARMCDAPLMTDEGGGKMKEIPHLRHLRSAARALLISGDKIPEEKKKDLQKIVLENYPDHSEVTEELLKIAADTSIFEEVDEYVSHGEKVTQCFKNQFGGLIELEKIWRQHFLETMRPKYLPDLWSVNHNENRLEIRLNEGRIEDVDVKLAGLKMPTSVHDNIQESEA